MTLRLPENSKQPCRPAGAPALTAQLFTKTKRPAGPFPAVGKQNGAEPHDRTVLGPKKERSAGAPHGVQGTLKRLSGGKASEKANAYSQKAALAGAGREGGSPRGGRKCSGTR